MDVLQELRDRGVPHWNEYLICEWMNKTSDLEVKEALNKILVEKKSMKIQQELFRLQ